MKFNVQLEGLRQLIDRLESAEPRLIEADDRALHRAADRPYTKPPTPKNPSPPCVGIWLYKIYLCTNQFEGSIFLPHQAPYRYNLRISSS